MSDLVTVERQGHVLLIGVNRPEKKNAWNLDIIRTVARAYTDLRDDDELRVGVVFGHGDTFTAGLDLMSVLPVVAKGDPTDILPAELCDPWDYVGEPCPKPIVVAVQGVCNTLAIELILASQVTVAASDTVFAQLEVARGIVPLGGASFRLPRLGAFGQKVLLTAEEFTAAQALTAGIVTEVVDVGQELDRAVQIAEQIAANAPLAVQSALATQRAGERAARDASSAVMQEGMRQMVTTKDAMEGAAAMMEKRQPIFTGT